MLVALAVLAVLGSSLQPPQPRPRLTLLVTGAPGAEAQRGIELGVAETSQTVRLLGGDVTVVRDRVPAGAHPAGVIVAAGGAAQELGDVPRIHLDRLPKTVGPCSFSVAPAADAGEQAVLWHPSLDRFGASELNERFAKRYGSGMTAGAYGGWVAVKALVESALRARNPADRCAAIGRLRFDGHKGRPLSFDPDTRILRQPLYLVENGRVLGEKGGDGK